MFSFFFIIYKIKHYFTMDFIDIFNFKKYFKKLGDGHTAKIGHLNAIIDELNSGNNGFSLTEVTYSELITLIDTSSLVAENKYLITDYTSKNLLNGSSMLGIAPFTGFDPYAIYTGEVEPLIVTASSTTTLYALAKSTVYSDDVIYYNPLKSSIITNVGFGSGDAELAIDEEDNVYIEVQNNLALHTSLYIYAEFNTGYIDITIPDINNFLNPTISEDYSTIGYPITLEIINTGSTAKIIFTSLTSTDFAEYITFSGYVQYDLVLAECTGEITRRIDPIKNIDICADWRNTKYRRFECTINGETGYFGLADNYYNSVYTGEYADYSIIPSTAYNVNINAYGDFDNTVFLNNICNDIKIIGNQVSDNTFNQTGYFTASATQIQQNCIYNSTSNTYMDCTIIVYNLIGQNTSNHIDSFNSFSNNTIKSISSSIIQSAFYNNTIGNYCNNNKFTGPSYNNNIGNNFYNNTISSTFYGNTFGTNCYNNTFTDNTNNNTFTSYCYNNKINSYFYGNSIGSDMAANVINCIEFSGNTIGSNFQHNIINLYFRNNNIANLCTGNKFFTTFDNNTVITLFQDNVINSKKVYLNTFNGSVNYNVFNDIVEFNTFNVFQSNIIHKYFANNTFSTRADSNVFSAQFTQNTINNASIFIYNNFKAYVNASDFTSATHVYNTYTCDIIENASSSVLLTYINGTTLTVVAITS